MPQMVRYSNFKHISSVINVRVLDQSFDRQNLHGTDNFGEGVPASGGHRQGYHQDEPQHDYNRGNTGANPLHDPAAYSGKNVGAAENVDVGPNKRVALGGTGATSLGASHPGYDNTTGDREGIHHPTAHHGQANTHGNKPTVTDKIVGTLMLLKHFRQVFL